MSAAFGPEPPVGVEVSFHPTAVQDVADGQDTLSKRSVFGEVGFGVG
jgi:hypothetical protein